MDMRTQSTWRAADRHLASPDRLAALARLCEFVGPNPCDVNSPVVSIFCEAALAGFWRAELRTGLLYWSPCVYAIYGFERTPGAINFSRGMGCYHPEDRELLFEMIERATRVGHGFSFNLRIRPLDHPAGDPSWRHIRTEARHHVNNAGEEEIFGSVAISNCTIRFIRPA